MTEIIIPIKDLSLAKHRLADALDPSERARLVLAMLECLLATVADLDRGRIWVVAGDDAVFDVARRFGACPVRENRARGYNAAVVLGLHTVASGIEVAVLPGDVPLATAEEIASLIAPAGDNGPTVRLAPARDGMGTNGLFLSSGDLIPPGFGPDSFAGYQRAASAVGIEPVILKAPGLAHDIDTPKDLRDFAPFAQKGPVHEFLLSLQGSGANRYIDRGAA